MRFTLTLFLLIFYFSHISLSVCLSVCLFVCLSLECDNVKNPVKCPITVELFHKKMVLF